MLLQATLGDDQFLSMLFHLSMAPTLFQQVRKRCVPFDLPMLEKRFDLVAGLPPIETTVS